MAFTLSKQRADLLRCFISFRPQLLYLLLNLPPLLIQLDRLIYQRKLLLLKLLFNVLPDNIRMFP